MNGLQGLLEFLQSAGHNLIAAYSSVPEILSYGFSFDGVDYTVWGTIFTVGGLTLFVSWTIIKWFISL